MAADEVTIVICYRAGTAELLKTCVRAIRRHTVAPCRIQVATVDADEPLRELALAEQFSIHEYADEKGHVSSKVHGWLLDQHIPKAIETAFLLTLDSDCFPVDGGWLSDLLAMLKSGARLSGILHPWAPPPVDMAKHLIEWRVRSQHCWQMTHVACQLIRLDDLLTLGKRFSDGDDTGLALPLEAKRRGWKIDGFKVTRCPRAETQYFDPEFNRYIGLIYGDKVYHQGGGTRTSVCGEEDMLERTFGWVKGMVQVEGGAEFLLESEMCYPFEFDREEQVAAEKMQRLFGLKSQRMEG